MFNRKKKVNSIEMLEPLPTPSLKNVMFENNNILKQNFRRYNNNNLSDQEGLDRAYNVSPNGIYVDGNKMYIAGTKWTRNPDTQPSLVDEIADGITGLQHLSLQDAFDDLKIPFFQTRYAERYQDAQKELNKNPQVDTLVSHSLGGAVALELNKNNNNKFKTTTYGAPVFQLGGSLGNRYRHPGDPVSILDMGAINVPKTGLLNPLSAHAYDGYNNQGRE